MRVFCSRPILPLRQASPPALLSNRLPRPIYSKCSGPIARRYLGPIRSGPPRSTSHTANAEDFREAVLRAVNLGDDADTTGAVCGQLAGAYWGESGIPGEWREGLAERKMIEKALNGLMKQHREPA